MCNLHKLQEAKKHNGQDKKNTVGVARGAAALLIPVMLVQERVESLLSGHCEHAALETVSFVLWGQGYQGSPESAQGNRSTNHSSLRCLP